MTIYINKLETNRLIFTLNESISIVDPKFILQIESKIDLKSKYLWLYDDISLNNLRYNEFLLDEVNKIDEDLEHLKVNLKENSYNWYVWQTDSDILDVNLAKDIIESGKLIINK